MSPIFLVVAGLATVIPHQNGVKTSGPKATATAMPADSATCRPLSEPKHLPDPSLVVDTAALFAGLDSVGAASPGDVGISLLWSDHPEGHLLEELPQPQWHKIVLDLLLASLRPAPEHAFLAVQVHVQAAPERRVWLEHPILCDPQASQGQDISPPFGAGVKTFAPSPIPGYQPRRVRAKTLVDANGSVTAVTIVSSSGYPEIDRALIQSIKAKHYRPALLDGRPVAVWVSDRGIRLAP